MLYKLTKLIGDVRAMVLHTQFVFTLSYKVINTKVINTKVINTKVINTKVIDTKVIDTKVIDTKVINSDQRLIKIFTGYV